jgi:23S rRNA pseudouridine1911/1915/1917 synthase
LSADSLIKQFKSRKVKKVYLALCIGNPLENLSKIIGKPGINILEGDILEVKTNIKRNKINREMMEVCADGGRLAISRFTVQTVYDLGKNRKLSLVNCEIETGRTHQIRVHAKLIECPIVGDNLYQLRRKEDFDVKKTILPLLDGKRSRQMLHARELSIVHPDSSKTLVFQGILPYDFSNLLSNLSKYKTS